MSDNDSHRVTLYVCITRMHNSRRVSMKTRGSTTIFSKLRALNHRARGVFSHLLPIDEPFEDRGWMRLAAGAVQPKDVAGRVDLLLAGYRRPVLRQNCNHIDNVYARSLPFSLCYLSTFPAALSLSLSLFLFLSVSVSGGFLIKSSFCNAIYANDDKGPSSLTMKTRERERERDEIQMTLNVFLRLILPPGRMNSFSVLRGTVFDKGCLAGNKL